MKKIIIASALISMFALSSCSVSVNGNEVDLKVKKEKTETASLNPEKAVNLDIDVKVGKINIEYGKTKNVDMNCTYKIRGINDDKVNSVLESIKLESKVKGDTVYISVDNDDFDTRFVNVTADLDIAIPDDFTGFNLESDVGDVKLNGLTGSFDIQANVGNVFLDNVNGDFDITANVGNIECKNISVLGDSRITANIGNIDASIDKVEKCDLEIIADVGDIDLDTQGSGYVEKEKSEDFVGKKSEILIDDKCTVKLSANVGRVKVKK